MENAFEDKEKYELIALFNSCYVAVWQIALEGLRIKIPPGISHHMSRMIKICMNEDPAKRPRFDMIIPILEKMKSNA